MFGHATLKGVFDI